MKTTHTSELWVGTQTPLFGQFLDLLTEVSSTQHGTLLPWALAPTSVTALDTPGPSLFLSQLPKSKPYGIHIPNDVQTFYLFCGPCLSEWHHNPWLGATLWGECPSKGSLGDHSSPHPLCSDPLYTLSSERAANVLPLRMSQGLIAYDA